MKKPERLTIGMRVRVLTLDEMTELKRESCTLNKIYQGYHAIIKERYYNTFSILTINNKWKEERFLPKETPGVIEGGCAWVDKDCLEFINAEFETNLDCIDWYLDSINER